MNIIESRNDNLHVEERRNRSRVKVTANGILILGIWNVIKMLSYTIQESYQDFAGSTVGIIAGIIFLILFAIILVILDLSIRYIIWRSAHKEADTGTRKNIYMACTVMLMLFGIYSFGYFIYSIPKGEAFEYENVISLLLDITSFVLLCELLQSVKKLRGLREDIARGESAEQDGSEAAEIN